MTWQLSLDELRRLEYEDYNKYRELYIREIHKSVKDMMKGENGRIREDNQSNDRGCKDSLSEKGLDGA